MENSRIKFIDLAKGICIIMVVMGHAGYPLIIPGLSIVRMPLYFMLSGLFFKNYGGMKLFTIKKTNKILIPFLFFYLTSYILFYLFKWWKPELIITGAKGILDLFNNRQFFNGPIWFLLALYWCNLMFCAITLYFKNDCWRFLVVCVLGFAGWYLGNKGIFVPLFIDVALTSMPFFTMGFFLKKTTVLYPNRYDRYNLLLFALLAVISYLLELIPDQQLSLHYNIIKGWPTYFLAFTSVMSILFLCKAVGSVPLVTYAGRYSIIILCVHHLIYRPLMLLIPKGSIIALNGLTVALITIMLSIACIPIFKRWLPWFVAQKDLIK